MTQFEDHEDSGRLWQTGSHRIADLKKIFCLIKKECRVTEATIIRQCPGMSKAQRDELLSDLELMEKIGERATEPNALGQSKRIFVWLSDEAS